MKKFIEKLIGRLEKERTIMEYNRLGYEYETAWRDCYCKTKEIVNQLAEEYKGGWIPCSERFPSYDGPFICTAKGIEESLELIYSSFDNSWMDEFDSEYEVIAWQPLPEPYQPKGE